MIDPASWIITLKTSPFMHQDIEANIINYIDEAEKKTW